MRGGLYHLEYVDYKHTNKTYKHKPCIGFFKCPCCQCEDCQTFATNSRNEEYKQQKLEYNSKPIIEACDAFVLLSKLRLETKRIPAYIPTDKCWNVVCRTTMKSSKYWFAYFPLDVIRIICSFLVQNICFK